MAVQQETLPEPASFVLDLIRFSAAILVVAAHLGHPEFRTNLPNHQVLGDIAVPFFFVLSGFVIRFVTLSREHTLREYLMDRASRIYSIALPAMALTLAVTALLYRFAPGYYGQYFSAFSSHPLARIGLNLTFLAQSWSRVVIPFTDSPFWSLSYECPFYLAYGLIFYLRGWHRTAALAMWASIAGPQILFLLPTWLLGCALYDTYRRLRGTAAALALQAFTLAAVFLAGLLVAVGKGSTLAWVGDRVLRLTLLPNPLLRLGIDPHRATMTALVTGVIAAASMLLLLLLSDLIDIQPKNVWFRRFRRLADGTFAIYLMHYPLMALAAAAGLLRPNRPVLDFVTVASICAMLIVVAPRLDRFKSALRRRLRAALLRPRIATAYASAVSEEGGVQARGKPSTSALWSR